MATDDAPLGDRSRTHSLHPCRRGHRQARDASIADAGSADRGRPQTDARGIDPPAHPRLPAALLMLAVVVLLVVVSLLSVLGQAR